MNVVAKAGSKATVSTAVVTASGKRYDFGPEPAGAFVGFKTWIRNRKIARYCNDRINELEDAGDIKHFQDYLKELNK